jgi:hypothetical protein
MKNLTYFSLIATLILALMSCIPRQGGLSDEQIALDMLVNFLESLHNGEYDEAARLYGETYETMIDHNPGVNSSDHAALLRSACTINGMQCLQVKSISLDKKVSDTEFVFKVDFLNEDGMLFLLGPCCGGDEADILPQSLFYFTVRKVDKNDFHVMDIPPYAP